MTAQARLAEFARLAVTHGLHPAMRTAWGPEQPFRDMLADIREVTAGWEEGSLQAERIEASGEGPYRTSIPAPTHPGASRMSAPDNRCAGCGDREYDHLTIDGTCWKCGCRVWRPASAQGGESRG